MSSFFDHYITSGEVIGFRLFRATGLAFAIRPKDGVARQGRRGGFHFCCSKACWNNFSVVVRVRGRATGLVMLQVGEVIEDIHGFILLLNHTHIKKVIGFGLFQNKS